LRAREAERVLRLGLVERVDDDGDGGVGRRVEADLRIAELARRVAVIAIAVDREIVSRENVVDESRLPPITWPPTVGFAEPSSVNTEITPPDALPYNDENGPRSTSMRCVETRLKLPVWPWPSGIVAGM
jgi:hypothetical protein